MNLENGQDLNAVSVGEYMGSMDEFIKEFELTIRTFEEALEKQIQAFSNSMVRFQPGSQTGSQSNEIA